MSDRTKVIMADQAGYISLDKLEKFFNECWDRRVEKDRFDEEQAWVDSEWEKTVKGLAPAIGNMIKIEQPYIQRVTTYERVFDIDRNRDIWLRKR